MSPPPLGHIICEAVAALKSAAHGEKLQIKLPPAVSKVAGCGQVAVDIDALMLLTIPCGRALSARALCLQSFEKLNNTDLDSKNNLIVEGGTRRARCRS